MLARTRILVLILIALVSIPGAAALGRSQQAPSARSTATAGPRRALTATAVHRTVQSDSTAMLSPRKQGVGKPVALMIVGGAALIVGLVIGGDVGTLFAIGGALIGLVGLYQYLQ